MYCYIGKKHPASIDLQRYVDSRTRNGSFSGTSGGTEIKTSVPMVSIYLGTINFHNQARDYIFLIMEVDALALNTSLNKPSNEAPEGSLLYY